MILNDQNGQPYHADLVPGPEHRAILSRIERLSEENAKLLNDLRHHSYWENVAHGRVEYLIAQIRSRFPSHADDIIKSIPPMPPNAARQKEGSK